MSTVDDDIAKVRWNADGLVPVIVKQWDTAEVLMLAWMDAEALRRTLTGGRAVYWSRSRDRLWRKGEESGHVQQVSDIRTDCDGDVILYSVTQEDGIACHTGRESCFFYRLEGQEGPWVAADPVLKNPKDIYK